MSSYTAFESLAADAAKAAGAVILEGFYKPKSVEYKGSVDLVTETDKRCEDLIMSQIKEAYPDHKFIGEEECSALGRIPELTDEPTWMIDPLDGTTNFVHRWPFVCVSIALAINKQVVVGVVFNPIMNELFSATRGAGAHMNGQPMAVTTTDKLQSALLVTEIGVARDTATMDAIYERIAKTTQAMRSTRCNGSCALGLCSVALGRCDAFYEINFGGPWDCAAGALIVEEAGGKVLDPAGGPFDVMARRVLATNAHLAQPLADILGSCKLGPNEAPPPSGV